MGNTHEKYLKAGDVLRKEKKYEEAIEQYQLAITEKPSYSSAYNSMGLALKDLKRYNEAIEKYLLAIQHNPTNSYPYNNMGNLLRELKRYEEAIEQFKLAIQLKPSYSSAYNNMGLALRDLKRYEESIEQFKLAIEHNPSFSNAHNNMGTAYRKLGRYDEAIAKYQLSIQYNPNYSRAYNNLGFTFEESKRYEEAIEQFRLAIQYTPYDSDAYYNLGAVLRITGKYDEAEEQYNHSIELLRQSSSLNVKFYELNYVYIAWIKIKRKDYRAADQIFSLELNNQLLTDEGMLIRAILLYKQEEYHDSLLIFDSIENFNSYRLKKSKYYYYHALCLWKSIKNGEENEVIKRRIMELFNNAIEVDIEWVKPYYRRSQFSLNSFPNDIRVVIQSNRQNPLFYQLSQSKISLLSSQQGNITHIDAEGLINVEYKGVLTLINGYLPPRSCVDHILSDLSEVLIGIQNIQLIANESREIARDRMQRINEGNIILSEDEAIAIASYSFDLGYNSNDGSGNLYQILNNVLRERNGEKMRKLQAYLYYLMTALSRLNAVEGTVYRGIPPSHKDNVEMVYRLGSHIHWSAFTSTTKSVERAKIFAGVGGIIFRIRCQTGRSIQAYSSFPQEDEVLLSPNCRLTVTEKLHLEVDGYHYVDFVENIGNFVLF